MVSKGLGCNYQHRRGRSPKEHEVNVDVVGSVGHPGSHQRVVAVQSVWTHGSTSQLLSACSMHLSGIFSTHARTHTHMRTHVCVCVCVCV